MSYISANNYKHLENDSAMIQAAVDEATKLHSIAVIPAINERTGESKWTITKAIRLHTGSSVCLEGCHIVQAEGVFTNIFTNSNFGTPDAYKKSGTQYDIKIYGVGNVLLDGGNPVSELTEENHNKNGLPHITQNSMFNFINCERISVDNVRVKNQRYWAFVFHYCAHGRVSNIDFYAPCTFRNQDGIDLRTGCSDFIIENITGVTGDDTVALTCLRSIYDNDMEPEFDTSINSVIIRNVHARTNYSLVRLLIHYGKKVYNILIDGVMEDIEREPTKDKLWEFAAEIKRWVRSGATVRIGENAYYKDDLHANLGDTYNVTVKNVTSRGRMGVRAACTLSDALIENVKMYDKGGAAVYFGEGEYKDVVVRDVMYSAGVKPRDTDDNRKEGNWNGEVFPVDPEREIGALYFKGAKVRNMVVQNVTAGENLTAVFGAYADADVKLRAANVVRKDEKTPVTSGEGLEIEFLNPVI